MMRESQENIMFVNTLYMVTRQPVVITPVAHHLNNTRVLRPISIENN
jgi:hypothetical protein